jgi:hypothetical protein
MTDYEKFSLRLQVLIAQGVGLIAIQPGPDLSTDLREQHAELLQEWQRDLKSLTADLAEAAARK